MARLRLRLFGAVLSLALLFALPTADTREASGQNTQDRTYAGFVSGNKLLESLREVEKANKKDEDTMYYDVGFAMGYVCGVLDADPSLPGPSITAGQAVLIVRKYVDEHPEQLHLDAADMVKAAIRRAFPKGK